MDGLCGIYSILNAISNLYGSSFIEERRKNLFKALLSEIPAEKLIDAFVDGVSINILRSLLKKAQSLVAEHNLDGFEYKAAFHRKDVELTELWESIVKHMSGGDHRSTIISLQSPSNNIDHWTCVKSITENSMSLSDSSNLKRLVRQYCKSETDQIDATNILSPTQTLFLWRC